MSFDKLEKLRDRSKRMRIEIEIGQRYSRVAWEKDDGSWVHSKAFSDYLKAWSQLRNYYLENEDPEMGIIVFHAYERSVEQIRLAIEEHGSLEDNIEELQTALQALEDEIDKIMIEGSMAFNDYYHDQLNEI